jgi:predicted transcriptional regulator
VVLNNRIISAALDKAEVEIPANANKIRQIITDDTEAATDISVAESEKIATDLERSPIDTTELADDLVSHETVRTHLNTHLDIDTSQERDSADVDETREMIASIMARDMSIIERALGSLRRDDKIETPPVDLTLAVNITCSECGKTYSVDGFFDNEGCTCTRSFENSG